jgi:hypothetical protein
MSDSNVESRPEAAAVAWSWRDRAARAEAASAREAAANRSKGLIGGAVGLCVAALIYFLLHRPGAAEVIAGVALLVALSAVASPLGLFKLLQRGLDVFAHAVGTVLTWVLLTLLYFVVFLPAGLILRRGKLKITRRPDKHLPTYWLRTDEREHARTAESYGKQF